MQSPSCARRSPTIREIRHCGSFSRHPIVRRWNFSSESAMRVDMRILICLLGLAMPVAAQRAPRLCGFAVNRDIGLKLIDAEGSLHFIAWDKDSLVVTGRVASRKDFFCGGGRNGVKLNTG